MSTSKLNRKEILSDEMTNHNYTVLARDYAFGQIRIQLTDLRKPDRYAPEGHGTIVRELDTYKVETAAWCMGQLSMAEEPEKWCIEQERDWNCEFSGDGPMPGDRIRLDETQESNPYRRCQEQPLKPGKQFYPIVNVKGLTDA